MENGALSNIIKPSRFGCFPEPLVAMYISSPAPGFLTVLSFFLLRMSGIVLKANRLLPMLLGLFRMAVGG